MRTLTQTVGKDPKVLPSIRNTGRLLRSKTSKIALRLDHSMISYRIRTKLKQK